MTSPMIAVQCDNCKNNLWFKARLKTLHCKAFSEGIPTEILSDSFDHTNPFPGDNGIRFEPIE